MARIDYRRPRVWVPAALVVLLLVVVIYRARQASTPEAPSPTVEQLQAESGIPVRVAAVHAGELERWLSFNGSVSGVRDAVIRARTGDQVSAVLVSVGDRVRSGQVVVRQAGEATEARVRQAEAARQQARRTVERLRPLHEAGALSDQEFDQALTQLELANADVAALRDALTLTSPLAGVVTAVPARVGMIPAAGDPLMQVADLSELVVRVQASAREAALLRAGQTARVGGMGMRGEVRRVALQADPATRLVEVEIAFPPGAGLIPGTLANVEVQVDERGEAVQVPRSAVRDGNVWVVQDQTATLRPVQAGLETADRVEILSGVEPGERVVVEGASLLTEGARVRVVGGGGEADGDV